MMYLEHSKGYVIYIKHPNGGISYNANVLEDELLSIGEIK